MSETLELRDHRQECEHGFRQGHEIEDGSLHPDRCYGGEKVVARPLIFMSGLLPAYYLADLNDEPDAWLVEVADE